jgi:uncharacterized SAM-binding protein YcdF (DUF218 family)
VPPTHSRPGGRFRRIILVAALAAVIGVGMGIYRLGSILYDEDPLQRADAIFVLAGTRMERPLEATDLYLRGYAPLIVLTHPMPDGGVVALERRGLHFPAEAELARDVMVRLGVPRDAIMMVPAIHDNTAQEALSLRQLVQTHRWRRVIVVTSTFHTRRTGFALRRELKGMDVELIVRASRYDRADPDHWWRTRGDFRFVTTEAQKLIAYVLGLGP